MSPITPNATISAYHRYDENEQKSVIHHHIWNGGDTAGISLDCVENCMGVEVEASDHIALKSETGVLHLQVVGYDDEQDVFYVKRVEHHGVEQ